jgi:hypothetical protein
MISPLKGRKTIIRNLTVLISEILEIEQTPPTIDVDQTSPMANQTI